MKFATAHNKINVKRREEEEEEEEEVVGVGREPWGSMVEDEEENETSPSFSYNPVFDFLRDSSTGTAFLCPLKDV